MPLAPQSLLTSPFALLALLLGIGCLGGPMLVCQQQRPSAGIQSKLPSLASYRLQQLTRATIRANEGFGTSVAVHGTTALVGCPQRCVGGKVLGSAHVFSHDSLGRWQRACTIEEPGLGDGALLGSSVALGARRAVVGTCARDVHAADAPAAYVYEEVAPHDWRRTAAIVVQHHRDLTLHAASVALDADTAIIAHVGREVGTEQPLGLADVFRVNDAGDWQPIARLTLPDARAAGLGHFGQSVALSGKSAIVGAPLQSTDQDTTGAAYVFEEGPRGTWSESAQLVPDDGRSADAFGISVAIQDRTALVGAIGADNTQRSNQTPYNSGAVYAFRKDGAGRWEQFAKLTPDDAADWDGFGNSVALEGDIAAIGAPGCNNGAGAVYVFRLDRAHATQIDKLTPLDASARSGFGRAVALATNAILAGAPAAQHNGNSNCGAAYAALFTKRMPRAPLSASNADSSVARE